jgi:hypothetical protein
MGDGPPIAFANIRQAGKQPVRVIILLLDCYGGQEELQVKEAGAFAGS